MSTLIRTIVIPNYPDKIQIAKSRRGIPYVTPESKVKGKTKIPKSFLDNDKYYFDEKGILREKSNDEVKWANPKTMGKARYWVVNFQDIWNQNLTKQGRAARIGQLKDILEPYIDKMKPIKTFPITIEIEIHDVKSNVDISNRGAVYTKVLEDLLVKKGKIPNDTVEYVDCSGRIKFIKIEDEKKKRMVVKIYKSDNSN